MWEEVGVAEVLAAGWGEKVAVEAEG